MCSLVLNWQYVIIGSDNGLVQSRRQAFIWTNNGLAYSRIYASLDLNELINNKWMYLYITDYNWLYPFTPKQLEMHWYIPVL